VQINFVGLRLRFQPQFRYFGVFKSNKYHQPALFKLDSFASGFGEGVFSKVWQFV
jgi:hypothetical protein